MKTAGTDPRSIRTRDHLRLALMALAAEKRIAGLCIAEVTRAAGVNRTTFYLHYAGLHELLEDCARALFAEMRSEVYAHRVPASRHEPDAFVPFVQSVFTHLERHETFYKAMLGRQGDPLFRGLFQELLSELIFEPFTGSADFPADPGMEMNLRFFSAGFAGVAAWWLEKGRPVSASEAALQVSRDILPDYLHLMAG